MKRPSLAPAYASMFPGLAGLAQAKGYALAIHGSMVTDLDLVAVPWTDQAVSADELAYTLGRHCAVLCGFMDDDGSVKVELSGPEQKPHGRLAWLIPLRHGAVVDLSVTPRVRHLELQPSAPAFDGADAYEHYLTMHDLSFDNY